jgi:putative oxidoreductase
MAGKGGGGDTGASLGLLALRVGAGAMLIYGHGWAKLANFAARSHRFSDPLHVGAPWSLVLAISAEVGCALLVMLGLWTRFSVIPLLILFGVITFIVQGGEPFGDRELGALYGVVYLAIALLGPGRYSIDGARGHA